MSVENQVYSALTYCWKDKRQIEQQMIEQGVKSFRLIDRVTALHSLCQQGLVERGTKDGRVVYRKKNS